MIKKKPFDNGSLMEALTLLQPVSPMDDCHPAHWWDGNEGLRIQQAMTTAIRSLAQACKTIHTKQQFKEVWDQIMPVQWPITTELNQDWWTNRFGKVILSDWSFCVEKFLQYINNSLS